MTDAGLFVEDDNRNDAGSNHQSEQIIKEKAMDAVPSSPVRIAADPDGALTNSGTRDALKARIRHTIKEMFQTQSRRNHDGPEVLAFIDFAEQVAFAGESLFLDEQVESLGDAGELRRNPIHVNTMRQMEAERNSGRYQGDFAAAEALLVCVQAPSRGAVQASGGKLQVSASAEPISPMTASMAPPSGTNSRRASLAGGSIGGQSAMTLPPHQRQLASPSVSYAVSIKHSDGRRPSTSKNVPAYNQQRFIRTNPGRNIGNTLPGSYQDGSFRGVDDEMDIDHDELPRIQNTFRGRRDGGAFSQPGGVRKRGHSEFKTQGGDLSQRTGGHLDERDARGQVVDHDDGAMDYEMGMHHDGGSMAKIPRSNLGEDHVIDPINGRRASIKSQTAVATYDNEGFAQPVVRRRPPQDGMGRYPGDEEGLYVQPRGDRGYSRRPAFPREQMARRAYDYYDDEASRRGRQYGRDQQYFRPDARYGAQRYYDEDIGDGDVSPRGRMSQRFSPYPPNRPRGAVAGGPRSPMMGQRPDNTERRQSRSVAQDEQDYYDNMAFAGQLPVDGRRIHGAPLDERALMRQRGYGPAQGIAPLKDEYDGHSRGRAFHPDDEPLHPQQRGISRQGMSQTGGPHGADRDMASDEFPSSPPGLTMRPQQAQPRPTPSTSGSSAKATATESVDGQHDEEDEEPRLANRRQSRASKANADVGDDDYMAMVLEDAAARRQREAAANGQQPITNVALADAVARFGITRAQDWGNPNQDRALRMAVKLRETIGYVLKERTVSGNTTARDRVSPLAMTQAQYDALSQEERRRLSRQRIERENLYIRACEMVMGVARTEDSMANLGPHSIIPRSKYATERLSGNSSGIANPDNILAVLEYEMFNTSFIQVAIILNDADKFANITRKKKFTKVAIHGRYNRCAEAIADLEGRDWAQIGSRTRVAVAAAGNSQAIVKDEPVERQAGGAAVAHNHPISWTDTNIVHLNDALIEYDRRKVEILTGYMEEKLGRLVNPADIQERLDAQVEEE